MACHFADAFVISCSQMVSIYILNFLFVKKNDTLPEKMEQEILKMLCTCSKSLNNRDSDFEKTFLALLHEIEHSLYRVFCIHWANAVRMSRDTFCYKIIFLVSVQKNRAPQGAFSC